MKLTILHPYESKEYAIAWLEVNTSAGNFVLQRGHAPMILVLAEHQPITFCLQSGKQERITVQGGILKIDRDEATIVVNG